MYNAFSSFFRFLKYMTHLKQIGLERITDYQNKEKFIQKRIYLCWLTKNLFIEKKDSFTNNNNINNSTQHQLPEKQQQELRRPEQLQQTEHFQKQLFFIGYSTQFQNRYTCIYKGMQHIKHHIHERTHDERGSMPKKRKKGYIYYNILQDNYGDENMLLNKSALCVKELGKQQTSVSWLIIEGWKQC